MVDASLAPVVEALEVAIAVARRDASTPDAPPPPRALAPFLRFNRLPDRALTTVRDVLDGDDTFRERVADQVDHDALEPGARLFLLRPEGWADELAALTDAAADGARRRSADQQESEAVRRAEQLESANERLRGELAEATRVAGSVSEGLDDERRARRQAEVAAADLAAELEATASSRAEAVRQLKATEELARERLERVRELERRLDAAGAVASPPAAGSPVPPVVIPAVPSPVSPIGPSPSPPPDPRAHAAPGGRARGPSEAALEAQLADAARSVGAAAEAAATLAAALAMTADALAPGESDGDGDTQVRSGPRSGESVGRAAVAVTTSRQGPPARPARRLPVRLGRGLIEDSVEGLAALLAWPSMVMMVDGYNVSMAGWPSQSIAVQRDRLVDLLANVQARTGAEVHVVFDGDDDGRRPAVSSPRPVRIHFTEAEVEADDRLLEFADRLPADVPVVIVSSDRRVRDGARARGANVVGSPHLLALGRR